LKILHTADWHIGKIVNQTHLTEDQKFVFHSLIKLIQNEKPDVLVIAGDIYDRAIPPVEAVDLLDDVLSKVLLELKVPVLMIAGNHDSPDRLGFGSQLLKAKGLHIEGRFQRKLQPVVLTDEYGPVNFYLVPYAPPAIVRDVLGREDVVNHDTAMQAVLDVIEEQWDPEARNVLVTHGFIRGMADLEYSQSEKCLSTLESLGGADYVDVNRFRKFTYTALGHLHGPQTAGCERVRYAGSLLKYSFSETNQHKSVTLVELGSAGDISVECKVLRPRRDMRKIKGQLHQLIDPAVYKGTAVDDYLHVTLTDEGELMEPMSKLKAVYPNVLSLEYEMKERCAGEDKTSAGAEYKQQSKLELFKDFYSDITGLIFDERKTAIVAEVIAAVDDEDRGR
jgi:DNA repair protein SbcD/Mre11